MHPHSQDGHLADPRESQGSRAFEAGAGERGRLLRLGVVLCLAGLLLTGLLSGVTYRKFPVEQYLLFHTVFEFSSIIVSISVFIVAWYGYRRNRNRQDLTIGLVFLMVGLMDLMHTLSYSGMPSFITPNTVSKASTLWIAARLISAIGILAAAYVVPDSGRRWPSRLVLLTAALAVVIALGAVIVYSPRVDLLMYTPGVGQTRLKIALEWLVIILYAASISAFSLRAPGQRSAVLLQLALVVSIFSELSFTLYVSAFDTYNLLGHIYKVIAYSLIFRALFVSSFERPYEQLALARDQLERSFSRIGSALASSLQLDETLRLIVDLASEMLGSRYAAVILLEDGDLHIRAQRGLCNPSSQVMAAGTSAGMAMETRRPIVVSQVESIEGHSKACHCQHLEGGYGAESIVSAPILSEEQVLGVVEVYSPTRGAFSYNDAQLLLSFARQAAVAIRNTLAYEREKTIAQTCQQSLLPIPPEIPGLDIAVLYVPADSIAKIGGDLYDVFQMDDDHLAIVIGDVSGHGLESSYAMAIVAYTVKALLMQGLTPAEAASGANQALCRSMHRNDDRMMFATLFVGILNTKVGTLRYANAGHHMPLLIGSSCRLMEGDSDPLLGIFEDISFVTQEQSIGGALGIMLYTDGVVEARRHGEMFGHERLCQICSGSCSRDSSQMLSSIVANVREWAGSLQDDIAMLAVRW